MPVRWSCLWFWRPRRAPLRHRVADALIDLLRHRLPAAGRHAAGHPGARGRAGHLADRGAGGVRRTGRGGVRARRRRFGHGRVARGRPGRPGRGVLARFPGALRRWRAARRGRRAAVEPAARLPRRRPDRDRALAGGVAGGGAARSPAACPSTSRIARSSRPWPRTCAGPGAWPRIRRTSSCVAWRVRRASRPGAARQALAGRPGGVRAAQILRRFGARCRPRVAVIRPVPVDEEGLDPAGLDAGERPPRTPRQPPVSARARGCPRPGARP